MQLKQVTTGRWLTVLVAIALTGAIAPLPVRAQTADEQKAEETKPKPKIKDLSEFIKDKDHIPGLFDFYRKPDSGELYMQVNAEQLGQEYIYFRYTRNGSLLRHLSGFGEIAENTVITLRRRFERIDFLAQNLDYTFPEDSTLSRNDDANIVSPLLATTRILAQNPEGTVFIIGADELFTRNKLVAIGGDKQGQLSKEKSSIQSVRSYADNSEIVAEYIFDFPKPSAATASSSTVLVQHNLIRMPPQGFEPRHEDPRVGYFIEKRTDLSSVEGLPYDDLIQRWRLVKANPGVEVSDPVQPIVYWIENTTPPEYRDIIREAALSWNRVFERAGFSNAIRVEVQPDDAGWDAGDVRYNVLRWVATPVPRYLGYGPRFTNPRTGEILGADVVLEHSSIRRSVMYGTLFGEGERGTEGAAAGDDGHADARYPADICLAGQGVQQGIAFARLAQLAAQAAGSRTEAQIEEIIREGLYYVVMHEVGHTLGLTHNMMGSYYRPPEALNGPGARQEQRLTNSVMDYPAVNIAPDPKTQGLYFPTAQGPYDYWAITYGYDERMDDPVVRTALLAQSTSAQLRFGNDADAMAQPDQGIDPRANTFDLSSDPIGFAVSQVEISDRVMAELTSRIAEPGESWDEVRRAFETLLNVRRAAGKTISRYIAGVYVDRAFVGQHTDAPAPFTPVSYADKKRAMHALGQYLFAPDAFAFPDDLIGYLQEQRRGFDFYGFPRQDPLVHAWVRSIQESVLNHLLDSRVLRRQSDSALYGNEYSVHEMMADLNREIFGADNGRDANTFRQNLQVAYVKQLLKVFKSGTLDGTAEGALFAALEQIDGFMDESGRRVGAPTRVHRRYISHLIEDGLED